MSGDPTSRRPRPEPGSLFAPARRSDALPERDPDEPRVMLCINHRLNARHPSCGARGGEALLRAIEALADDRGLANAIEPMRCLGHCQTGPAMRIAPGGAFYDGVTEDMLPAILDALEAARNNRT